MEPDALLRAATNGLSPPGAGSPALDPRLEVLLIGVPVRVMPGLPSDMGLRGLLAPLGQRPAEVLLLGPPDDVFAAA